MKQFLLYSSIFNFLTTLFFNRLLLHSALAVIVSHSSYAMDFPASAQAATSDPQMASPQSFMVDAKDLIESGLQNQVALFAVKKDDVALLRFLLAHKVNLREIQFDEYEMSLLHKAAWYDSPEAAKYLIDLKVPIDWPGHSSRATALALAISQRSLKTLRVLLANGANANSGNWNGGYHGTYTTHLDNAIARYLKDKYEYGDRRLKTLQEDSIDREIMTALIDKMEKNEVKKHLTRFVKKLSNQKNNDNSTLDVNGTNELFPNPPSNNYLTLLPIDLKLIVKKLVGILVQKKALQVVSILHHSTSPTHVLFSNPPANNYFALLPANIRTILYSIVRLTDIPVLHHTVNIIETNAAQVGETPANDEDERLRRVPRRKTARNVQVIPAPAPIAVQPQPIVPQLAPANPTEEQKGWNCFVS